MSAATIRTTRWLDPRKRYVGSSSKPGEFSYTPHQKGGGGGGTYTPILPQKREISAHVLEFFEFFSIKFFLSISYAHLKCVNTSEKRKSYLRKKRETSQLLKKITKLVSSAKTVHLRLKKQLMPVDWPRRTHSETFHSNTNS